MDEIEGTASSHDLSEFWREHFADRRQDGYPSFEEMLVLRRGFTLGLGDRPEDHEGERGYAEAAWAVVSPSMPDAWFDRFEESPLGSPFTFDLGGRRLSGGAVVNGLTASRIGARCEDAGLGVRPLRVLEIGAGYGQVAHQLIQALEIESYSICDLPENLLLSAFYLQGTFSERGGELIGPGDTPTPGAGLVFTVPPFLERLEGPFDLIVNSYSFQEMNRESVDEYFDHARRNLADDGVFYSLNAHGKAGIERPSQYPVEQFRLASVSPVRRFPFQIFATNPYEIVLRQKGAVPPPARHSADQLRDGLDAIGFALQLGFHEELLPLCEAVAEGTLDDSQRSTVAGLRAFFEGDSEPSKREALDDLGGAPDGVRDSLLGALEFAVGNDELAAQPLGRAAATLPDTQARLRALMELAALEAEAGDESEAERAQAQAAQIAPHLEPELRERVRDRSSTAILLASQLSLTRQPQHEAPRIARLLGRWARNPHG